MFLYFLHTEEIIILATSYSAHLAQEKKKAELCQVLDIEFFLLNCC